MTDGFGIDRETIRVELAKEDPGSVGQNSGGFIEITVPESKTIEEFAPRVKAELESMGYTVQEQPEDADEDEWPFTSQRP